MCSEADRRFWKRKIKTVLKVKLRTIGMEIEYPDLITDIKAKQKFRIIIEPKRVKGRG